MFGRSRVLKNFFHVSGVSAQFRDARMMTSRRWINPFEAGSQGQLSTLT